MSPSIAEGLGLGGHKGPFEYEPFYHVTFLCRQVNFSIINLVKEMHQMFSVKVVNKGMSGPSAG